MGIFPLNSTDGVFCRESGQEAKLATHNLYGDWVRVDFSNANRTSRTKGTHLKMAISQAVAKCSLGFYVKQKLSILAVYDKS